MSPLLLTAKKALSNKNIFLVSDPLTKGTYLFVHLPCFLTHYIHVKTSNRPMLGLLDKTSAAVFMITYIMTGIL